MGSTLSLLKLASTSDTLRLSYIILKHRVNPINILNQIINNRLTLDFPQVSLANASTTSLIRASYAYWFPLFYWEVITAVYFKVRYKIVSGE